MEKVLVLNASDEPLGITVLSRAANLVLDEKADIVVAASQSLRSPSYSMLCPQVIRLRRYVHVPFTRPNGSPSLTGLLARDGRRCAYCHTRPATTIDHVVPRSRGGHHSWENTVGACSRCNARKANRTPHEASMQLSTTPQRPPSGVWLALANQNRHPAWEPFLVTLGLAPSA